MAESLVVNTLSTQRHRILDMLDLLGPESDPEFDALARIAARVAQTPIALTTFLAEDRQWVKGRHGWERPWTTLIEAFCACALEQPGLLEVQDTWVDRRFKDNPLAQGEAAIRFYAGHPIVFEGVTLGTVCVLDYKPRALTLTDRLVLADLATVVGQSLHGRHETLLRRQLAAADAARALAEQANKAKTQFVAQLSHELRTPLSAVLGYSQLLEIDKTAVLTPHQGRRIAAIRLAGEQILSLVNDMLDLSRLEEGRLDLHIEPVDVRALVQTAEILLEPTANERGVVLRNLIAPDMVRVPADPRALSQVLINLISNAIKYNRPQGTVTIDATMTDSLRLIVQDTGQGLTPAQLQNVYQPFNRLGAENGSVSGTGLGLVITKALVEAMRGELSIESEVDRGTRVTVSLPLASD